MEELSKRYGLAVDLDAKVENITVGMQQRVEILKMLYRDNEVLIFDEPTAVLTPQEIVELMQIMKGLAQEGKSILFISHKLNEIMEVSDRVTVLRKGRYVGTVNTKETTAPELSRMMVGHDVQLVVDKAPAQPGETVLDVCAAPGGKSFTIAELMQDQGHVYAYDLHEKRVGLIRQGAEKLKLTCITAQAGDARETEKPQADRILCDVPCSGFGVIRRKPEIRYKSLDELASLPEIQYAILEASAKALKAGGVLVYSTCTVLKRENEDVVRRFLAAHPEYHLEKPWQNLPALASYGQEMTTLFPQMLGSDGFFIAKMRKRTD